MVTKEMSLRTRLENVKMSYARAVDRLENVKKRYTRALEQEKIARKKVDILYSRISKISDELNSII